jgi:hypothetical protein
LRTRVVLKVICSVDDGNAVVVAAGSGEEDLRQRKTVWRGISAAVDASIVGAAQLGRTMARQERDKPHKGFFDTYLYQK